MGIARDSPSPAAKTAVPSRGWARGDRERRWLRSAWRPFSLPPPRPRPTPRSPCSATRSSTPPKGTTTRWNSRSSTRNTGRSTGSTLVAETGYYANRPADATTVDCTGNIFKATVGLGDGKDDFTPANYIQLEITENGEGGKDQLTGGLGNDTLRGNAGNDYSDGGGGNDFLSDGYAGTLGGGLGAGNDQLIGNAGNDFLDGGSFAAAPDAGSGADLLEGGPGLDTADYSKRTVPLTLTEGDGPNDGQDTGAGTGSEADDLASAETIDGGSAGDTIAGAEGDNTLSGGAGNDTLRGGGGTDTLRGGNGDDSLDGGAGPDLMQGGHGIDTATYAQRANPVSISLDSAANDGAPGEGDNVDQGTENVEGGSGNDTILTTHDATGRVTCGPGTDTVRADTFDAVAADCETVRRSALPDPSPSALAAIGLPKRLKVRHGVAHLKLACPPSALGGCAKGRVSVLTGKKTLARARFTVAAGVESVEDPAQVQSQGTDEAGKAESGHAHGQRRGRRADRRASRAGAIAHSTEGLGRRFLAGPPWNRCSAPASRQAHHMGALRHRATKPSTTGRTSAGEGRRRQELSRRARRPGRGARRR